MRVVRFPSPMLPAQFVYQPKEVFRLWVTDDGVDFGPPVGVLPFGDLQVLAAYSAELDGMERPIAMVFVTSSKQPLIVRAAKIEAGAKTEGRKPVEKLWEALVLLANQRPGLFTDQNTLEFLRNDRHLRPVAGGELAKLSSAFGRFLASPESRQTEAELEAGVAEAAAQPENGSRVSPLLAGQGVKPKAVAPPPIVSRRSRGDAGGTGGVVPPVKDFHHEDHAQAASPADSQGAEEPARDEAPAPPPVSASPSVSVPPVSASPSVSVPPVFSSPSVSVPPVSASPSVASEPEEPKVPEAAEEDPLDDEDPTVIVPTRES